MLLALNPERRRRCENVGACKGIPPGNFFKKIRYLTKHFVCFEDSLLGNKAGKSESHYR